MDSNIHNEKYWKLLGKNLLKILKNIANKGIESLCTMLP
jgi:hypothetical protein|tara:strand:- start:372 stop:488 length:117 start_codon:yes stop_codon:yes gene_type:complete